MNRFYSWVAYLYVGYLAYKVVQHHGTRWAFGEYGLPTVLMAPDGVHYPDGVAADPIMRAIVAADLVIPVQLVLYLLFVIWVLVLSYYVRQINRNRRIIAACHARSLIFDRVLEEKRNHEQRKG